MRMRNENVRETLLVTSNATTRAMLDGGTGALAGVSARASAGEGASLTSDVTEVYHYSADGTIRRFAPQVPSTNPSHPPAVWAIDGHHAPLYWFPRDCPRVSVWANDPDQQARLTELFATEASRICAAESSWVTAICASRVYRYSFDAADFAPSGESAGRYISLTAVHPVRVEPIDDLLGLHAEHDVELRFTPRFGPLVDQMLESGLPFAFVRIRDAKR